MNDRQRTWFYFLGGALGFGVVLFIVLRGFWMPYQDLSAKLDAAEAEYVDKEREMLAFKKERKKLDRYRLQGLPADVNLAKNEYHAFLKKLYQDSGLTVDDLPGPSVTETKSQPKDAVKKPGHTLLTYQVRAAGDWAAVVKFLEKFQRAPFLHRVKNFTMDRQGSAADEEKNPRLAVAMHIEAMVVHHSEKRPGNLWGVDARALIADSVAALSGAPAGWSLVLRGQAILVPELPARKYADLARKNPFVGELPPPAAVVVEKTPPPPPPDKEVLQFVRLNMTSASEQKATLFNRMAVKMIELSPRNDSFDVFDDNRRLVVSAAVVRIDQRDVYFQVGEHVYGIHLDQDLAQALKKPLSTQEIDKLGLPVATEKGGKKGKN